jgi:hypothetical protein
VLVGGWDGWLGCGREGRGEDADMVGVRTAEAFVVALVSAEDAEVLVGSVGESDGGVVAVTVTAPGSAASSDPGDSGAMRFAIPSSTGAPDPPGPCRIPGAAKAKAAMAAVDRLPMAIGAGRSGLKGLRARWRAL